MPLLSPRSGTGDVAVGPGLEGVDVPDGPGVVGATGDAVADVAAAEAGLDVTAPEALP
jgi:hypothetical protein